MKHSNTPYVILGLLLDGPLSGYDIKKLIGLRFAFFWDESFGQIYPELKRMAGGGFVELLPGEQSGRNRKVYRITDSGLEVFKGWLNSPPEKEKLRMEFLMKFLYAPLIEPAKLVSYLDAFKQRKSEELEMLGRVSREIEGTLDLAPNHRYILQAAELGIAVNRCYLEWAAHVKEALVQGAKS